MIKTSDRPFARVIYSATGRGLRKDASMIQDILASNGWQVELVAQSFRSHWGARCVYYWERVKLRLPRFLAYPLDRLPIWAAALFLKRADLQVHLQNPVVSRLGSGRANWLIPNQEWARMDQIQYLASVDLILCKTRAAETVYRAHNQAVRWIGFSSSRCEVLPEVSLAESRYRRFLHVGGNSLNKGTGAVVEAWRRNPAWPVLDLVVSEPGRFDTLPANVRLWQKVDDKSLLRLRDECGVVLAPSSVEGFGHVLLEGMAWGAVVVTTDAPPMNELVTEERGILVPWVEESPVRLGTRYRVAPEGIEKAVEQLLHSPAAELKEVGRYARMWVLDNHRQFVADFEQLLRSQLVATGQTMN